LVGAAERVGGGGDLVAVEGLDRFSDAVVKIGGGSSDGDAQRSPTTGAVKLGGRGRDGDAQPFAASGTAQLVVAVGWHASKCKPDYTSPGAGARSERY